MIIKMKSKVMRYQSGKFKPLILTVFFSAVLMISAGHSQALHDTYLNGIYYDQSGQARPPSFQPSAALFDSALFATPGTWPTGLTKQGTLYWISDTDSSKLYKLSRTGGIVGAPYDTPLHGYAGLDFVGANLWAVHETTFKLYKINPDNGLAIDSLNLPRPDTSAPDRHAWGLAYDGGNFWHSQYGQDAILYKLNPANGAIIDSIVPPVNMILGIAWQDPFLCGVDIRTFRMYRFSPELHDTVDSYDWNIHYPLGLHYDGVSFYNVSSKIEYGGDQAVYLIDIETGINDKTMPMPLSVELYKAYPNPFNASTNFSFSLPQAADIRLDIYDMLGRKVSSLLNEYMFAGYHTVVWHPDGLGSGMYFYRITAGDYNACDKVMLLK
jgi:hypothetical protein